MSLTDLLGPFAVEEYAANIRDCLKKHLDTFDALRDTQVQLLRIRQCRKSYPAAEEFFEWLQECEKRFVKRARRKIERVKTKRLRKWIRTCGGHASSWKRHHGVAENNSRLVGTVEAAFRRTSQLKDHIDSKKTETIHRTRVAFKKFRYMVEALSAFLPGVSRSRLEEMHDYQTLMGDVQDLEVLRQSFQRFAHKRKLRSRDATAFDRETLHWRDAAVKLYLAQARKLNSFWTGSPESNGHPSIRTTLPRQRSLGEVGA